MRIALVSSSFPRFPGDYAGIFVYELAQHLTQQGMSVHVLAPHDQGTALSETRDGVFVHRFPYTPKGMKPVLCYGAGIPINLRYSYLARLQTPSYIISLLFALRRLIKSEDIQLVNSHWLLPQGVVAASLRWRLGIPHICTVHSSETLVLSRLPLAAKLVRWTTKYVDQLICVSQRTKERLEQIAGTPLPGAILPMGVNLTQFQNEQLSQQEAKRELGFPENGRLLLFVGRLEEVKGVHFLLPAYARIRDDWPDSRLCIVGTGRMEAELQEQARILGLADSVNFLGRISHENLPAYYRSADLVVIPSIIAQGGDEEGMPVVLLEALAAGCRIVTTTTGGAVEIIVDGRNGFLAAPADVDSLRKAMTHALVTPLSHEFKQAVRQTAQRFDWAGIAAFYRNMAQKLALHGNV
jgi:glycosyltransferase involved in cell wall biosynthesis